ncbi:Bifunctional amine oxidase [Oopsacas minuta]|uniref:Bifunctional amine oxidase n=1 Tax=Oopsacas minuta TaxID=111878 RepID=A0AAV7JLC6_9METZ|nr:Bifunctional amine oxidase [Oopsacas minuta]
MAAKDPTQLYDVIIVGGGPVGLAAAYECAVKRNKKVLLLEQFTFHNDYSSSPGYSRQWRICYSERYLCQLAIETRGLWHELIDETNNPKLVKFTGVLWFGDSSVTTAEGNIEKAVTNLKELSQDYCYYKNPEEIRQKFPFISGAVTDSENFSALLVPGDGGGSINVLELIKSLLKMLKASSNCDLLENTKVTKVDYSISSHITVTAGDLSVYSGKKVIMTPSVFINELLETVHPPFEQRMGIVIYLWCSNYFSLHNDSPNQTISENWPVWIYFAPPKDHEPGDAIDANTYYGFPTNKDEYSGKCRVAPGFTSKSTFNFYGKPPPIDSRPVDEDALRFTQDFVRQSMPDLQPELNTETIATCVAGFALNTNSSGDPGFVLDFLTGTDKRIVLYTSGWAMKFVPLFGKILADKALNGESKYDPLLGKMEIGRGVMYPGDEAVSVHASRAKIPQADYVKFFQSIL